jgi:hypothetical protein
VIIILICERRQGRKQALNMEKHALKNANNCLNTSIGPYLDRSGGQNSNAYLNVVHFFNARLD